jgi:PKD repeat protein
MTTNDKNSWFKWVEKVIVPLLVALLGGGCGGLVVFATWACNEGFICSIEKPKAEFTAPAVVKFPLPVSVNNTSSGAIEKYNWDFGNGRGTEEKSPKFIDYFEPGEYTITLIVQGKRESDRFSRTIKIISDSTGDSEVVVPPDVPEQPEVSVVTVSPTEAFSDYFKLVEQQSYNTTWTLLTENWKARFNTAGFAAYQAWVENIASVSIDTSEVVCQTDLYAVILADLTYMTKSSSQPYVQQDRYFRLRAGNDTWLLDDAGENPRTCNDAPPSSANTSSKPTTTPIATDANFASVAFCLEEPTRASRYACANPVTQFPSGISIFYYSRSFQNVPIGTQMEVRWYRDGNPISNLKRSIIYEGRWVTSTGFQYSWVQEDETIQLVDGLYSIEIFIDGDDVPDQKGAVRIGG